MAGNAGLTFTDVINEALGHLNVYTGDPLQAADLQSAFFTLCAIIDGYGAEKLMIWQQIIMQFLTSGGKSQYLLGLAGATPANDWIVPALPPSIKGITFMLGAGGTPIETGIKIRTELEWKNFGLKTLLSNVLTDCWPNLGATAHALNFYPQPNASLPVNLYIPQPVVKPTAVTNSVVFPPSYQEAITFELVIKASSKFGAEVPSWIPEAWKEAKGKIKEANFEGLYQRCDSALLNRGRYTGGGSIDFYEGK
jgi:hypothetical protein